MSGYFELMVVTFLFEEGFLVPNGNSGNDGNNNGNDDNENTKKVIAIIKKNPNISLDKIVEEAGISKRTISRETKRLQDSGVLIRIGSARSGHWKIVE